MSSEPKPKTSKRARSRRWRRVLIVAAIALPVLVLGLWIAIHRFVWLGPMVADSLRAVIGKDAVTELENIAYGIQDRFYQYYRKDEQPRAYWEVTETAAAPSETPAEAINGSALGDTEPPVAVKAPAFRPRDVGPVHKTWSAPGDGQWLPIAVPDLPELPARMWKTLLHPDKNRSWAEVFVVALAIEQIDLHLVAGSKEPIATVEAAMGVERPARVPPERESQVLAAFNGGFKTEHGGYGMRIGDTVFIAPLQGVCAIALFDDGHIEVSSWEKMAERESRMRWWRQTPNCMAEDGELHPRLKAGHATKWGATLDGETVIRRSAVGTDESGRLLFVAISNHTTANAIAEGLLHAGAISVAQLDVNFSYPKFVLFEKPPGGERRLAVPLASGFEFSEDEYIRKRSPRDFFYITARAEPASLDR